MAVIIVLIFCLILIFSYPPKDGKVSALFRVLFYAFVATLVCVYLHDSVIKFCLEDKSEKEERDRMMETVGKQEDNVGSIHVKPSLKPEDFE